MSKEQVNYIMDMFKDADEMVVKTLLEELGDPELVIQRFLAHDPSTYFQSKNTQNKDAKQQRRQNNNQNAPKDKEKRQRRETKPKQEEKPQPAVVKKHKQQTFAQASNAGWGSIQMDAKGEIISYSDIQKKQEEEEKERQKLAEIEAAKQRELEEEQRKLKEQQLQKEKEEKEKQQKAQEEKEKQMKAKEEEEKVEAKTTLFAVSEIANVRVNIRKFGTFARY